MTWQALLTIVLAIGGSGGLATYLGHFRRPKGVRENDLIDQLQEETATLRVRMDRFEHRERVLLDYVGTLRYHIYTEAPPPPPPFPDALKPQAV